MEFATKFIYHFSEKNSAAENTNFAEEKNNCDENTMVKNPVDNRSKFSADKAWRTFQIRVRSASPGVTFYESVRTD